MCTVVRQCGGGGGAGGGLDVVDYVLCRCESIQQGVIFILKSFIPTTLVADDLPLGH